MISSISFIITMRNITFRITIFNLYLLPLIKLTINRHLLISTIFRNRANPFVTTNILCHLHIVIICISSFHRLNGSIKLGIILIYKIKRILTAQKISGTRRFRSWGLARFIFSCRPLIPIIQIEKLRILF